MRHTWVLTMNRMQLALRNRAFIFFSLVMPLAFLFFFEIVFGRSGPRAVNYVLAVVLALTVMGSFWGLSIQLVTFREQGILRRFRLAPVGAGALLASSIVSNYFLTLPTVFIEFVICRYLFKMSSFGNLWIVILLITVGTATFSSLGLIVASVSNNLQETQVVNNLIWSAFLFLSGATVPLPILPGWVQGVALFLPATYLVTGLQGGMLRSASASEIAVDVLSLCVALAVAFEVSRRLFRWEPEAKIPGRAKLWVAAAMLPFLLLGAWEVAHGNRIREFHSVYESIQQPAHK